MSKRVVKVPVVMQMEALECGAASLAMILAYYGRWVPLEELRVECGVSRDGSKASNIAKAARRMGLTAKGRSCSIQALENVNWPCILFWNFNHFVVFCGFKGKYAYINDPARGRVRVGMEEFDAAFTGVVIDMAVTEAFEQAGRPRSAARFVLERLRGLWVPIVFTMLVAAIASVMTIASTSLSRVFIDQVLDGYNGQWISFIVCSMVAMGLVLGLAEALQAIYLARVQSRVAVVSSSRFMRHLLHMPWGFFEQRMIGDIQQRQSANETVALQLIGQLAPVFVNALMLVLYLLIMARNSIILTCIGIASVVANALLAQYVSKQRVNINNSQAQAAGKLYATSVAGIEAIETIKASGAEVGYFQRWAGYQAVLNEDQERISALNSYLGSVPAALVSLANVLVLVVGSYLVVEKQFTPGLLLAFQGYLSSAMLPVTQMIALSQTVQEMQTQMERIDDVMRYPADVPESAEDDLAWVDELEREKLRGRVDLDHVTFGYSPLEPPLIDDFSLHVEPGAWVALVGSSGSGKSTIAKLVSGLYKPWSGEIRFDGMPADEIRRPLLRGSLAVVDQDIVVFDDSVADNIRLWDKSIEDFEVILACRDADIHDEVVSRAGGYHAQIAPGGRNFSGGQLQRLEIARVLAQDPTIVILDEATSALDAATEARVMRAIRERGITCIVVAHRLSTIRDCEEIIVLDAGRVVERGTHASLLAACGTYARLVGSD